jgi:peptidoglycan/LPS O-acetylase OafA/YrhL
MICGVIGAVTLLSYVSYKLIEVPARAAIIAASSGLVRRETKA